MVHPNALAMDSPDFLPYVLAHIILQQHQLPHVYNHHLAQQLHYQQQQQHRHQLQHHLQQHLQQQQQQQQAIPQQISSLTSQLHQQAPAIQHRHLSQLVGLEGNQSSKRTSASSPPAAAAALLAASQLKNQTISMQQQHQAATNYLHSLSTATTTTNNNQIGNQYSSLTNFKLSDSPGNSSVDTSSNTPTGSGNLNQQRSSSHSDKPPHSYIGLIGMCILSSPEKKMLLSNIYDSILREYPYYRNRNSGWRNSVRHNLSLNECFQKSDRSPTGKGHYWTIHPANMEDFMRGDFRRRRAQRKVRRWNNMEVPSDESDDESIDVNKPPLPDYFKNAVDYHRRLEQKALEKQANQLAASTSGALQVPGQAAATTSQQFNNQAALDNLLASNYLAAGQQHHQKGHFLLDPEEQGQTQQLLQHSTNNSKILMKRLNL